MVYTLDPHTNEWSIQSQLNELKRKVESLEGMANALGLHDVNSPFSTPAVPTFREAYIPSYFVGDEFPTEGLFTGYPYYHTGHKLAFQFNGTLWVTPETVLHAARVSVSASGGVYFRSRTDLQLYFTRYEYVGNVATTNDVDNYWTYTIYAHDSALLNPDAVVSFSTIADSPDTWEPHAGAINDLPSVTDIIQLNHSKTGSPGAIQYMPAVYYALTPL